MCTIVACVQCDCIYASGNGGVKEPRQFVIEGTENYVLYKTVYLCLRDSFARICIWCGN